jgi:hypothetical protein
MTMNKRDYARRVQHTTTHPIRVYSIVFARWGRDVYFCRADALSKCKAA